ncbi:MAG: hypothetical protein A2057_02455 [Ignavibacteria bacterium GWA2_35_9]|nr:MAG: hypothetical protein A2057_02455 [Ignavibacteria bacterium GWA2_35_9]OGU43157.1 MAG: hypothetical protein A2000_14720 [Ignavibacteria bacterium GWB2_36_8]OGU49475.1 MAG: hypothetical protein A2080_08570 [Ignavibacteria bacterium GWC2_36_12]
MYKISFLTIIILAVMVYGQKTTKNLVNEKSAGSYAIAGSDLLRDEDFKVAQFLKDNPDFFSQRKMMKASAWNFTVGSAKSWRAVDFTNNNTEYWVASTCRAVGTNCYIFVADDVWENTVDQNSVDAVADAFDNSTPANPNKGIYQTNAESFGNPPDVDNDTKIIILILDIKDGYTGSGGYVAGYFSSANETRIIDAAEIYFMDANPTDLKTSGGLNSALKTAAHEFQHMINWNYHKINPELTFINEGLSEAAEIVCGYGASMQSLYSNEPNHYLFDWRTNDYTLVLNDYARAQRFFLYLMEQFGVESLKSFVQAYSNYGLAGISGLEKILENYSTSLGKVFLNFSIANGLNDLAVHNAYGYSYQPLPYTTGSTFYNPNINATSSTLRNLGAEYFTFSGSSDLNATFTSPGSNIIVKALEIGTTSSRVVDVPLNTTFSEPEYPSTYSTIRFVAIDTNQTSTQAYQYQASGTVSGEVTEFKWDGTEPVGYLNLPAGDTVCVVFDAFNGGVLNSVKVGLRQAGSINGGVWAYGSNGSPLKTKLAGPFTATILTTPGIPYPVPWSNWATIDLTSENISTDQSFAVAFAIPSSNDPKVMVAEAEGTDFANSLTYDVGNSGWLFYVSENNTTYQYLIRAYVSLTTGIEDEEIELTPNSYSLSQNYPNPFNPSTTIEYQIARDGFVNLKVYDVLGREVKILVNEFKTKGKYNVILNAEGLTSGMYFYKLEAGNIKEVKKIILIK